MKLNPKPSLNIENYPKWAEILEESGVCTDTIPNSFLETRLRMRMSVHGFNNFHRYYNYLKSLNRNNMEWRVLIDSLTVKETRFFRDPDSLFLIEKFLLSNQYLPGKAQGSIHAWSVACATGEEAYSLAIIIDKNTRATKDIFFGVTATDISHSALTTGKQGIYHESRLANIPPYLRTKYFIPLDDNFYQVKLMMRNRVCFSRLNVLQAKNAPLGKMNIIVCQNFLIYFSLDKHSLILDALVTHLAPGGLLILSISDVFNWSHPALEKINYENTLAYRRKADS
ncbi:MCP methyltransferase, CheR-type [Nitrosococcus oceani ATCC 19707]|uniref:protein-glutamate O-methyltransferase n=2 Tax=Nitrosococcus oceani TaxID=1229 RepID=Q3JET6_NITOC|nr:CheR family methyltransferase [Nitrosococcus oceani]ABA56660.1 MCP methyltransferase, CheR-type [Nitrosococcus oceani ATCC 19707]EDZ66099.1 CheR methyltransferase, SAM binding domain protein [Nitrosococcus oceani AFC27]KFI20906.1 chemotaxis protein CheR [Nitrosococcus oceani C-27]GEM20770.1 chemotaxis protein CheR [Nitrosococcus oceani]